MKFKIIYLFVFCIFLPLFSRADNPFRDHRYDAFKVLPECQEGDIVFIGNSITHMMNWNELFGNRINIRNRGVSGALSSEVIDNLESMISDHPSKIFLMIGTNDLGTEGDNFYPEPVAERIKTIVNKIIDESPESEVYFQSILPSKVGLRTQYKTEKTNLIVKQWIDSLNSSNVKYIDLYSSFVDNDGYLKGESEESDPLAITYDGLHLTQKGYKIWGDTISKYLGIENVIPDQAINLPGKLKRSPAMRASYFGSLPIEECDVVLIGDEMIHGGEWHELLNSSEIKERGIGWGYPGISIKDYITILDPLFNGNRENDVKKETPKVVGVYLGAGDIISGDDINQIKSRYNSFLDSLKTKSPGTSIFLMTILPMENDEKTMNEKIFQFNQYIRDLSHIEKDIYLIDIEKDFVARGKKRKDSFFMDKNSPYLNGLGYVKIAGIISDRINKVTGTHYSPISAKQAKNNIRKFNVKSNN